MNRIWTEDELIFLKENYPLQGAKFCAEKLSRSVGSIHTKCYLLKIKPLKETITRNNKEAQLKYNKNRLNTDFNVNVEQFLNIETPEVAYFLGFLWADGYIVRQEVRLSIAEEDMNIIKPTLNKIGKWNYNIRVRDGYKPICTAITSNKRLFDFLIDNDFKIKSGASADKILSKIPYHLKHYFFRGLIDGDGCIDSNKVSISSNYKQDWKYVYDLNINLGIKSYIYRKEQKTGSYSVIEMNGVNGLMFCEYIYKDREKDDIGLNRKFIKYLELQNSVKNGRNYIANEKKSQAIELFNNGIPITEIIKTLNIASTTVRRCLKESLNYSVIQNNNKITEEDILNIRIAFKGGISIKELYNIYCEKISFSGFKKICYNQTWKHINLD